VGEKDVREADAGFVAADLEHGGIHEWIDQPGLARGGSFEERQLVARGQRRLALLGAFGPSSHFSPAASLSQSAAMLSLAGRLASVLRSAMPRTSSARSVHSLARVRGP